MVTLLHGGCLKWMDLVACQLGAFNISIVKKINAALSSKLKCIGIWYSNVMIQISFLFVHCLFIWYLYPQ